MAPTRSLNVVIAGDTRPLGKATDQADKHIARVEKSSGRMGKAVKAGFLVAAGGAGLLAVGLKKSADAAAEAEKSQARMEAQLKASGISYRAHAKQIDDVIQKHSKLAGVDDEDLQDAFTNLVRSTGSVNKAMKDLGLVTDIARAKNIDVAKAGELLGKVHAGNVGVLKRYGISFKPVTDAQDKLRASNVKATDEQKKAAKEADKTATSQKALAELQKRFGGQAEAYGKTAAGAQERFAVAVENVQEKVGAFLLPVMAKAAGAVAKFLEQIDSGTGLGGRFASVVSDGFTRVKTAVEAAIPTAVAVFETLRGAITNVVGTIGGLVQGFQDGEGKAVAIGAAVGGLAAGIGTAVVVIKTIAAVTKIWAAAQAALNVVMTANPIGLVVAGLVALGAGLVIAYKKSETFRGIVDGTFKAVKTVVGDVMGFIVPKVKVAFEVIKTAVSVAATVVKTYVTVYAKAAKAIVGAIIDAFNFLKDLPGKVAGFLSDVTAKIRGWVGNFTDAALKLGKGIGKGIIDGLGDLGHLILSKVKGALDWVAGKVKGAGSAVGKALGIGDGIGDGIGKSIRSNMVPAFGGSLMGARPSMAPFAGAAARFGLRVSSGRRPGAITSSGNKSYHSTGEAIDVAGSPAGMLGFFRQMKEKYGSRLAELIYTPGGAGIKDGNSYTYGGAVAADHFDHVHVAYDTGVPGVGDGIGAATRAAYNTGLRGNSLVTSVAIAGAESDWRDKATNFVYPDHSIGDWQINQLAHKGRYGTDAQLKNVNTNARAMHAISGGGRNWGPWSTFTNGAYKAYVARARAAVAALTKSGAGKSGSGSTKKAASNGPSMSVTNAPDSPTYDTDVPEVRLDGGRTALDDFLSRTGPPVKGKGPTKGLPVGTEQPADTGTDSGSSADPNQPLIDAMNALAEQTRALKEQTEALNKTVDDQTKFAQGVQATETFQLKRMLGDLVNGELGGRGVARRFTAGSGVEYAY